MIPEREYLQPPEELSFRYQWLDQRQFPFHWHVHPEYELTAILAGRGRRFVGDHIDEFGPGDLVLLGADLPHTWWSPLGEPGSAQAIVVQFAHDWMGDGFLDRPELRPVARLLREAGRGLRYTGAVRREVIDRLRGMKEQPPMERFVELLRVLDRLTRAEPAERLASEPFAHTARQRDPQQIEAICRHLNEQFTEAISQQQVARWAGLSPSAFSRLFKRVTGRTFVEYLHHLRVGHACRQLIETEAPITRIGFEAGFGNLANFNRVFRRLKGTTPRRFRQQFRAAPEAERPGSGRRSAARRT